MSEIRKLDSQSQSSSTQRPKIIGANPVGNSPPEILDKNTKQEPVQPEVRIHEERVTEDSRLRQRKTEPGDPEVRLRISNRQQWEKVKRTDDEADQD